MAARPATAAPVGTRVTPGARQPPSPQPRVPRRPSIALPRRYFSARVLVAIALSLSACRDAGTAVSPGRRPAPAPALKSVLPASSYASVNIGADLGMTGSDALAVNSVGMVVGTADVPAHGCCQAWLWRGPGDVVSLPPLSGSWGAAARGINTVGQVVGNSGAADGGNHAVMWRPPYTTSDVIDLAGGAPGFQAYAINDAGQVVGTGRMPGWPTTAFLWTQQTGMTGLPLPAGQHQAATPVAINKNGDIAGWYTTDPPDNQPHAIFWPAGAAIAVDLGTLNPGGGSLATGVNDAGVVSGWGSAADGGYHLFTWSSSGGMVDRGPFLGGVASGGINAAGTVVGSSGCRAFTFTETYGFGQLPSSSCTGAHAINDNGVVVGSGAGNAMWVPAPPLPPPSGSACVTPPSGLIALWRGNGATTEDVAGRNGAWVGAGDYAPGVVGQAFSFHGIKRHQ